MRVFHPAALLAVFAFSTPALAETTYPDWFSATGALAVMNFGNSAGGGSDTTIIGDFGVSARTSFGLGLTAQASGYRDGVSAFAGYGALTFTAGPMTFSYGKPQPAFDAYARSAFSDRFAILNQDALTYSASYLTLMDLDKGKAAKGARFDLNTARFDLALSQHEPEGFGMGQVLSASARFDLGHGFTVSAGYETVPLFMTDVTKTKLAVAKDFGKLDVQIASYRLDVDSFFGDSHRKANEIGVNYQFNDRWAAGFAVLDMPDEDKRVTSADVSYRVWKGASLVAGASKTTGSDGYFWGVGLRYDF